MTRGVTARFRQGIGYADLAEDVLEQFLRVNGLKRMVQGHSVVEGGVKWWFGETVAVAVLCVGLWWQGGSGCCWDCERREGGYLLGYEVWDGFIPE
ncbi:MAG: hypothetical protein U9N13_09185 [Euryarchaeota archaeon]|nr:hypothetical protein [Euryarchaeota archaeon]